MSASKTSQSNSVPSFPWELLKTGQIKTIQTEVRKAPNQHFFDTMKEMSKSGKLAANAPKTPNYGIFGPLFGPYGLFGSMARIVKTTEEKEKQDIEQKKEGKIRRSKSCIYIRYEFRYIYNHF